MARKEGKQPTNAELEILQALWERGSGTVREVFNDLSAVRETGYTTVLKLMQIMTEKGLLTCDKKVRPQRYRPARSRSRTQRQLIASLIERAFNGSPGHLVLQALSARKASPEDRKKIRALLDKLEGESK